MRHSPNKLWAFGPPISLLLLAFAYYVKVDSFRNWVDGRFPWAKEHLARFVPEPEVVMVKDPHKATVEDNIPSATGAPLGGARRTRTAASSPGSAVQSQPAEPLTMARFMGDPSLWPKTVKLRRPTEFPAVVGGKPVGKIQAPAGTIANLVRVTDQQLGVEFQGGGTWVPIAATDLAEQVKITDR